MSDVVISYGDMADFIIKCADEFTEYCDKNNIDTMDFYGSFDRLYDRAGMISELKEYEDAPLFNYIAVENLHNAVDRLKSAMKNYEAELPDSEWGHKIRELNRINHKLSNERKAKIDPEDFYTVYIFYNEIEILSKELNYAQSYVKTTNSSLKLLLKRSMPQLIKISSKYSDL